MPTSNTQLETWAVDTMPPVEPVLITSPEDAATLLPDGDVSFPRSPNDAITYRVGDRYVVACDMAALAADGTPLEELLAILAHEAFHCALGHLACVIGDDDPSSEELAYHVQAYAFGLFSQFFAWLDRQ